MLDQKLELWEALADHCRYYVWDEPQLTVCAIPGPDFGAVEAGVPGAVGRGATTFQALLNLKSVLEEDGLWLACPPRARGRAWT